MRIAFLLVLTCACIKASEPGVPECRAAVPSPSARIETEFVTAGTVTYIRDSTDRHAAEPSSRASPTEMANYMKWFEYNKVAPATYVSILNEPIFALPSGEVLLQQLSLELSQICQKCASDEDEASSDEDEACINNCNRLKDDLVCSVALADPDTESKYVTGTCSPYGFTFEVGHDRIRYKELTSITSDLEKRMQIAVIKHFMTNYDALMTRILSKPVTI